MTKIKTPITQKPVKKELLFTREFDAPRPLVWKAWTDPNHVKNWWGPRAHPSIEMKMVVQPGGTWRACLQSAETGEKLWHRGIFREVVKPERIVFTFAWEEEGERGLETLVTITFAEHGEKTRMTFHQSPFQSVAERDGHQYGWASCFDRLDEHLTHLKTTSL
ncbi:MAG: SRPBCC domain-containing protein [Ignavibacteriales bacterium]|nr:SRPBCC domain-containing protein [Ignavibacteriales bacterium]